MSKKGFIDRRDFLEYLALVGGSSLLAGCLHSAPKFAMTNPEQGASVDVEKILASKYITRFPIILPPSLLVELPRAEFFGTWPVVAINKKDPKAEVKTGFAYLSDRYRSTKTSWGLPFLEAVFIDHFDQLVDYKFILANRDGMVWVFSPDGRKLPYAGKYDLKRFNEKQQYRIQTLETLRTNGYDLKRFQRDTNYLQFVLSGYDYERFSEDTAYRRLIFDEMGMSLEEIVGFWRRGFNPIFRRAGLFESIRIDERNERWQVFKANLLKSLPYVIELGSGKRVVSGYDVESYRADVRINPGLTGWQRFLKHLSIPATPSVEALAFSGISSILNFGFQELVSDPVYAGNSASAMTTRKDMADLIVWLYRYFYRPAT